MFFLSSPTPAPAPQALPNPFSSPSAREHLPRQSLTHSYTKQHLPRPTLTEPYTRENSYTKAYNTGCYTPHAPSPLRLESSPLRTARNANLMSSPTRSNGSKTAGDLLTSSPSRGADGVDENWVLGHIEGDESMGISSFHAHAHQTPAGKLNASMGGYGLDGEGSSSLVTPPDSASHPQAARTAAAAASSPFGPSYSFAAPQPSGVSQWGLRSRESSPSSLLAAQTTRNREERKSRFLDRIRRRRDDQRSELVGDQVLRMDFVKERRGWEEQMARRAAVEAGVRIEDEEEDDDDEGAEAMQDGHRLRDEELSPTEEYEDLVREYEYELDRRGDLAPEEEFPIDDADDEEYERLFREMEILSQPSVSQSQGQSSPGPRQQEQHPHQQGMVHPGGGDDAMDIS
ncbi:hypothetical protein PV04_06954 [Phialophora macrospora]|uniref:Uncharacterized protein n=1 Tax=Phialophora macrospora TaxID=1851006 RepID=A0A0D2E008_9EURO|nr:hypothetical protein PV04_06954 [Phialophora macrospora]